ncbi:MAG: uroporphyrinogen-III synthase, partial [Burkholderiaceae bacterium]
MRVIVTRPEREAQAWAETLARHGIDAVVLPLIDIRAVSDTAAVRMAWQRLDDYAALMFVSGAAVDHFFALRPPGASAPFAGTRQGPRLWCAGPGTAAALLRHGIARTSIDSPAPDSGQFDSEALWQVVRDAVRARDKVLVVRGGEAAPDLSVGGPALQQAPPEGATILEAARPLLE